MERCCFLIHGQNSSKYFSDSDEKRTRSPQSFHCWAWGNWLPSKMRFHLHLQTLLSAILLCLHYCSGHIFECHRHIDGIPVCISKLFFQGFRYIEKITMVQEQSMYIFYCFKFSIILYFLLFCIFYYIFFSLFLAQMFTHHCNVTEFFSRFNIFFSKIISRSFLDFRVFIFSSSLLHF